MPELRGVLQLPELHARYATACVHCGAVVRTSFAFCAEIPSSTPRDGPWTVFNFFSDSLTLINDNKSVGVAWG